MARSIEAVQRAKKNYLLRHPDRRKASVAAYYQKNKKVIAAYHAIRNKINKPHLQESRRKYKRERYAAGKDTPIQWQKDNPEKVRVYKANTRAKRNAVSGKLTVGLQERLLILQQGKCSVCQVTLKDYHLDHIMPIALGGINEDHNIQLLCPYCNQTKNSKHPIEFMQKCGYLL